MSSQTSFNNAKYNIATVTKSSVVVLIIISALFVFLSLCMTDDKSPLEEDAFITFRYVKNFLHGNGLVFNKSERVEAISNILWALLLAFLSKLGFPLLLTSSIAGMIFGILSIWIVWYFTAQYFGRRGYFQFIAALLIATNTSFIRACICGLETAFYTFLIIIGTISSIVESGKEKAFPYSAIIFAFASMTRPEAPLLFIAILFTMIFKDLINHKISKTTTTNLLVFSCLYGFFIAFRIYYYGDILPNTVYARASTYPLLGNRVSLLLDYIVTTKSYFIYFPALFLFFRIQPKKTLYQSIVVITVSVILLLFSTNDFHFVRYLCPVLPLCFILVQEGIFELSVIIQRSVNAKNYKPLFIIVLLPLIFLANFLGHTITLPWTDNKFITLPWAYKTKYNPMRHSLRNVLSNPSIIRKKVRIWYNMDYDLLQNFHALFGDWIRRNLPIHSIIVYDQMGQTPFYAGLSYTFIDSLGLTDKVVTETQNDQTSKIRNLVLTLLPAVKTKTNHNSLTFSNYILSRNPDFIFIFVGSEHLDRLTFTVKFNSEYEKYFPDVPVDLRAAYRKISLRN